MNLSQRLKKIAESIIEYESMADIGSDHAYLPIYLIKNNQVNRAIASDVNKGPVEISKERIKSYNVYDKIDVRHGDGLSVLKPGEAEIIVIAGMGGILITEILDRGKAVAKAANKLILQPMRDSDIVRKWLYKNNFNIIDEELVKEENKFYEIIWIEYGEARDKEDEFMLIGRKLIEKSHPLLNEYLEIKIKEMNNIIKVLEKNESDISKVRMSECRKILKYYLEVQKCAKQNVKL